MNEDNENNGLENLIIKNKDYYRKRRLKICLIIIPIIFFITIAIILIIFRKSQENKIICEYIIDEENENEKITLINIKNDVNYDLIIDDKNYGKKNYFIFESYGIYSVTFDFKNKLDSLDGFFEGNINLIYADLSKLQIDNIESMANLFKNCINLKEVFIDNKTPNLKNLSTIIHEFVQSFI